MSSLSDLLNPSFFITLGIVVLFIALVVVYFESKIREQNHKIASMLSLVSTMAEEMNGMKMVFTSYGRPTFPMENEKGMPENYAPFSADLGISNPLTTLIEVSDDDSDNDSDDDNSENSSDGESSDDINDIDDDSQTLELEEQSETMSLNDDNNVKVIKLNINENAFEDDDETSYNNEHNLDCDLANNDDLDDLQDISSEPKISEEYTAEILNLKYDNPVEEETPTAPAEFKTVSIDLGEEHHHEPEHIDFKKLQLPKLRSIAIEKGLSSATEANKLKKPELLKLLGVE